MASLRGVSLSRAVRWVCLSTVLSVSAASCTTEKDTEAYVPSGRGAVQPDAGGPLLAEDVACSKLKAAESRARTELGCPEQTRACPDYIRPAGGADCFQYSQASIDGCAALYTSFSTCADFDAHPCLLSAVDKCEVTPPPSGEGGAGGQGAGDGGASGAPSMPAGAGQPGAAGDSAFNAGAGGA